MKTKNSRSSRLASPRSFLCWPAEGAMTNLPLPPEIKAGSRTEAHLEKQLIGFFKLKATSDWMIMGLQACEPEHSTSQTEFLTQTRGGKNVRCSLCSTVWSRATGLVVHHEPPRSSRCPLTLDLLTAPKLKTMVSQHLNDSAPKAWSTLSSSVRGSIGTLQQDQLY